jgi:hypothetical protein
MGGLLAVHPPQEPPPLGGWSCPGSLASLRALGGLRCSVLQALCLFALGCGQGRGRREARHEARGGRGAASDLYLGHISTDSAGAIGATVVAICNHGAFVALTIRLSADLQASAADLADKLGVSLNALVSVALADYLMLRHPGASGAPPSPPPQAAIPTPKVRAFRAPKSRSDPCPCGALDALGYPLKWRHCHGAK